MNEQNKQGRKTMKRWFVLALLSLCVNAFCNEIDLVHAKSVALKNNSEYLSQQNSYRAAVYDAKVSFLALFPTGEYNFNYLNNPDITKSPGMADKKTSSKSYSIGIRQPIFVGGSLVQSYKIKRDLAEIQKLNLDYLKLSTVAQTENKYFNVLMALKRLEIAEDELVSAKDNLSKTKVRVKAGISSEVDLVSIQSDVSLKEINQLSAQTDYEVARAIFIGFLKLENNTNPKPISIEEFEETISLISRYSMEKSKQITERIVQIGLERNLMLAIKQKNTSIAKRSLLISKLSTLPSLSAAYTYAKDESFSGEYGDATKTLSLNFSLALFPVLDKYYNYKSSKFSTLKASEDYLAAKRDITVQIRSAALNLISSAKQISASKLSQTYALSSFRKNKVRFDKNLISSSELLDAEVKLKQANLAMVNSEHTFLKAKTNLKMMLNLEADEKLFAILTK